MTGGATRSGADSSEDPLRDDLTGRELAGCRIVRKLGQGAMGTVYLGTQVSLDRQVAIKVLDPKFSRDLIYIERFEREAQASARLVHFNVVQVYDFGRAGEIYYIISEFVDGTNVQRMIEDAGILPFEQATELVLQAAKGLAAAGEAGIVHRDIKPENLMVNTEGVVKITDFGLAKVVQDDSAVTQSGMILGTPFYMSPEQAKGMTLDPRSDLYSLGVSFFHMLTGEIPFDGDSVISVLLKHISAERPHPSDLNPSVPNFVGDAAVRLMARDPSARIQSAGELVAELERVLARLRAGEMGEETAPPVQGVDPERLKRYKRLRKSLIAQLSPRAAGRDAVEKMRARCKVDAGVFVESQEVYPPDTVLQVRFTVPGRAGLVEALGLVRWSVESGFQRGMGVTFLSMQEVDRPAPVAPQAVARRARLDVTQVVQILTQTALHARLLKYYFANSGRVVGVQQVAGAMGVGVRLVEKALADYKSLGMVVDKEESSVLFLWPDDPALQNAIIDWMQEFGLR